MSPASTGWVSRKGQGRGCKKEEREGRGKRGEQAGFEKGGVRGFRQASCGLGVGKDRGELLGWICMWKEPATGTLCLHAFHFMVSSTAQHSRLDRAHCWKGNMPSMQHCVSHVSQYFSATRVCEPYNIIVPHNGTPGWLPYWNGLGLLGNGSPVQGGDPEHGEAAVQASAVL